MNVLIGVTGVTVKQGGEKFTIDALAAPTRGEHPLAKRNQINFSEMLEYPWVGTSMPSSWRANLPQEASYGLVDERSDRAKAQLIMDSQHEQLRQWLADNDRLKSKIETLKTQLKEHKAILKAAKTACRLPTS